MRILAIITAAVTLCSCGSKSASVSASDVPTGTRTAERSESNIRGAGTIVLDQIEQQKGHIVVEPVHTKDVPVTLVVPGHLTLSEDRTWRLGAIATGRIEDLKANLGDAVRADQLLGHIHSHEVHEARAGYEQALVELDRARSTERYAKERRDRAQRLFDLRAGSRQDVETAEVELQDAEAAIRKAQSELEKEQAHLAIFRIPLGSPAGRTSTERKMTYRFLLQRPGSLWNARQRWEASSTLARSFLPSAIRTCCG